MFVDATVFEPLGGGVCASRARCDTRADCRRGEYGS